MIGSYIKTSRRSILRNKLFSLINIAGLGISMAVGLIMIAMFMDVLSYDNFHEKHDRIYRVTSKSNKSDHFSATSQLRVFRALKESIAGPEDVVAFHRDFSGDVTNEEKVIPLKGYWASESLFDVFSFHLLKGNPATALKEPFSVILTERSALKLFGHTDILGKAIKVGENDEYTITGVLKDIPVFSHIKFEMLGSLSTREITKKESMDDELHWANRRLWTYVLLPENGDPAALKTNLDQISERENRTFSDVHFELALQPLNDIMMGGLSNETGPVMGNTIVWVLGSLSFLVLLSACFNYMNLSIARSSRRSREVGIRKTIGASKGQVMYQFIVESVIISLLALVFSFLLFLLIKPHFLGIELSLQELLILDLSPMLITLFILFSVVVGVLAGVGPAMFFGRLNSIQVLKNLSPIPVFRKVTLRKSLIIFQYCISIITITATIVIHKQYKHFISYDLGFSTENILNIPLQGNKAEILTKELEELPEVQGVSRCKVISSLGTYEVTSLKNPATGDSANVYYNVIDENYLLLHNYKVIAGNNFNPGIGAENKVIVNLQTIKRFNIAKRDPLLAIGETVQIGGKNLTIMGVLKDFEYGQAIIPGGKEVVMIYSDESLQYLNVKILSDDWVTTHSKIEGIWQKIDPVHPLVAQFYDAQIEEAFIGLKAAVKVGGFLAFIVICIASIGLLGMVVFTAETRLKEISIRKVFGASEVGLLYLLSKGFLLLLAVAAGISLPVTYLFFEKIVFNVIANHAPLRIPELLLGAVTVMLVALVMIGSQTLKVSRANPAEILKNE